MLGGVKRLVRRVIREACLVLSPLPKRSWHNVQPVPGPKIQPLKDPPLPKPILQHGGFQRIELDRRSIDEPFPERDDIPNITMGLLKQTIYDDRHLNRKIGAYFEALVAQLKQDNPSIFTPEEDAQVQRLLATLESGKAPQDDDSKGALRIIGEKGSVDVKQNKPKTLREAIEAGERGLIASQ